MSRTLFAVALAAIAAPALGADPATIDWTKVPASAATARTILSSRRTASISSFGCVFWM